MSASAAAAHWSARWSKRTYSEARDEKEVRCSMKRVKDCDTGGGVRDTLCLILVASTTTVEKQVGGDVLFKRRERKRRCVAR